MRLRDGSQTATEQAVSCPRRIFLLVVLLGLFTGGRLFAQTANTGALSGVVSDPSAAAVAGAEVSITEAATGYKQTVRTNGQGQYRAPLLPPGTYTVEVTKLASRGTRRPAWRLSWQRAGYKTSS